MWQTNKCKQFVLPVPHFARCTGSRYSAESAVMIGLNMGAITAVRRYQ